LRLKVSHLCPEDRVLRSGNNALLRAKAELFSTTRASKRKFEVLEGLPVFKDLHGDPVLRRDGGHVEIVLSLHMVGFRKPGKMRKKKRAGLMLLCITVL
jgi:hypothetical protein